jgi:hypothetical protein
MTHRCDVLGPYDAGPLTRGRVYRALLLSAANSPDARELFDQLLAEIDNCAPCLISMIMFSVGLTLSVLPAEARTLDVLEQQLAAALDQDVED